ncbi:MAG: 1-acyl-sn-glycerol-3-phosphate acyltransferase [Bacilli bacterium]|nr:1-acyl-sn-glycerol-3-phosphate acyltransferase [Bacilli bacterium]MBN2876117.1 1-acyl-sn-glycerol-3-phosphate acyltransferase [Bacilli bacterium]
MLALIQIVFSILFTVLYSTKIGITFDFWGVMSVLLIFIVFNLLMIIFLWLIFLVYIFATAKLPATSKHKTFMTQLYNMYLFRFFYRVRLIVTGKENLPTNNNFVMYANHIEYTDPLFIKQVYGKFPLGFVSKEPLFKYPVLSTLLYSIGCIPITALADRSALKAILQAIKQVKEGQPMGIFPEGKRTYCNDLIEFKAGAFKLVQKAGADLSPVVLYNMHDLSKKWRIWPTKVYLHVLPLVPYETFKDKETATLSDEIYQLIDAKLDEYKHN